MTAQAAQGAAHAGPGGKPNTEPPEGPPTEEAAQPGNWAATKEQSGGTFNGASMIAESAVVRCRCCGHVLTTPKAIAAGIGWRCAARRAAEGGDER